MPTVIIECAFANDYDEGQYAQTGYTEITQFVKSISGDLRGRKYELGRAEAGTITLTLDNADGRFTPGRPASPYYPNVKSNRRLRIRGKNMLTPNVSSSGQKEHDASGYFLPNAVPTGYAIFDATPTAVDTGSEIVAGSGRTWAIQGVYPSARTGFSRLVHWYSPVEYGTRLTHSVYIRKSAGTLVAGATFRFEIHYYDADWAEITTASVSPRAELSDWPTTWTRVGFSHTPPNNAKYGLLTLAYLQPNAHGDITWQLGLPQTELPDNLAPNPSGYHDALGWNSEGAGDPVQSVANQAVEWTLSTVDITTDLARLGTVIPHLIPGERYSASMEMWVATGAPNFLISADEGQSGTTYSTKNAWTTVSLANFEAVASEQPLDFYPLSNTTSGQIVRVRKLNVKKQATAPGLGPAYGEVGDYTTWEHPKPIFEGWTESWPARVGVANTDVSVTVVDRLKRVGTVELSSVIGEMLFKDAMDLIVPFTESPTDSQGAVSNIGRWADTARLTQLKFQAAKGDIGNASYTLGIDGPTGETAIQFSAISDTQGYSLPVPFSADWSAPPAPAPAPKPPGGSTSTPTSPTPKTYTRVYNSTWSRTYDEDNSTTWDDSPLCYQGYYSADRGRTKSLIGFNYAQIRSDLSGSTVKSVKLTMRNEHWYWNSGGIALIGTHNYTTKPSVYNSGLVWNNRILSRAWPKDGQATVELGVTIGNEFKAGTTKGIALGPTSSTDLTYYGYFRGATLSYRPYLTITFVK